MGHRPPELLVGDLLVGDRLHHLRAGHVHVGAVLHHEDEVGHGRRVDRAARARTHDERDLGDDPRGEHVALKDLGVSAERGDPFLDACAAGIVQADDRGAHLDRVVHDLADLLRVRLRQRAAEHREVLAEHEHEPAIDGAVAGDHPVAGHAPLGHAEIDAAVLDEHVPLLERAGVEQHLDPLSRGEPALRMLRLDAPRPAALPSRAALRLQGLDDVLHDGASFAGCIGRRNPLALRGDSVRPQRFESIRAGKPEPGTPPPPVELNGLRRQAQPFARATVVRHRKGAGRSSWLKVSSDIRSRCWVRLLFEYQIMYDD